MNTQIETIKINGVDYVRADSVEQVASLKDGMKYVIVRTFSAGVFAGYLESRNGQEVVMRESRRLWQWFGAMSLSQLAIDGTAKPKECKFPAPVDRIELMQAIEIIDCTAKARKSIQGVPIWTV